MEKNGDGRNREEVEKVKKWGVLRGNGESFPASNTQTGKREQSIMGDHEDNGKEENPLTSFCLLTYIDFSVR